MSERQTSRPRSRLGFPFVVTPHLTMIKFMQIFPFFSSENFSLMVMHRHGPVHSCFWAGAETKNLRMEKITLRNLRCSVLFWQCNVQCDTMQWNAIQCNAMHPCNVQCAVWCNAMLTFNVAPILSSSSPAWINLRRNINFLQQLEIFTSATSHHQFQSCAEI